jgi:rRNA-processing protein FCF1
MEIAQGERAGIARERGGERRAGVEVVGTGRESADDWITQRAAELDAPYVLVTSDRELRERAGGRAERVIGGGAFAGTLVGTARNRSKDRD